MRLATSTLFIACTLIWGTTWYAITFQLDAVAPEAGVALRFAIVALFVSSMLEGFDWHWQTWAGIVLVAAGSLLGRPLRNLSSTAAATPAQSHS